MKISSRKQKGSNFEYSVRDSLAQKYPDVLLTKQEGFANQTDITIHSAKIIIECKKHKGFSWNELEKYLKKLSERKPDYTPYLIFQGNRQPCLVMYVDDAVVEGGKCVRTFPDVFGIPFIKHKGRNKDEPL